MLWFSLRLIESAQQWTNNKSEMSVTFIMSNNSSISFIDGHGNQHWDFIDWHESNSIWFKHTRSSIVAEQKVLLIIAVIKAELYHCTLILSISESFNLLWSSSLQRPSEIIINNLPFNSARQSSANAYNGMGTIRNFIKTATFYCEWLSLSQLYMRTYASPTCISTR